MKLRNEFYCIGIYDVQELRVKKVHKIFKKYLNQKQNSVFVGELLKSDYLAMTRELKDLIDEEVDEICFMITKNKADVREKYLGRPKTNGDSSIFF